MSAPHPTTSAAAPDTPEDGPRLLSRASFAVCLGICLAIFVALNPFWERLDMDQVNDNILWSYAPIPLLVPLFLALEKKLGLLAFMLDCIRLTFVKFAITFIAAQLLWGFTGPPPLELGAPPVVGGTADTSAPGAATHASGGVAKDDFFVRDPPAATALDPAALGRLTGRVTDAHGAPAAGVLVCVSGGLDAFVFAPPTAPFTLGNDDGWHADDEVVQAHQLVRLEADDEQLHTAELRGPDGRPLFNYPLAPGSTRELMFKRGLGRLSLACKVHGASEPAFGFIVTDNPFFARTDADGRFRFEGVPAGPLELTAWPADDAPASRQVALTAGQTADAALRLP